MTNIYSIPTTPYTYLICWSALDIKYYGVRYATGCHPNDLWQTYFTSSRHVLEFVQKHGAPDIIEIRKTFNNCTQARLWETRVLKRLKVIKRDDYLNKSDNVAIAPQFGDNNSSRRPEVKYKIQQKILQWHETNPNPNLGKLWSAERKQKRSEERKMEKNPFYGHKHTKENLRLFSENQQGSKNSFHGHQHSQECKSNWSRKRKGIPKPKICCINCRKEVGINVFPRWHGDNCKNR